MTNLAALLAKDLSTVDPQELAQGVRDAERTTGQAPGWSGKLLAAMHEYAELSWSQIAEMTGVTQTTAYRRALPFLPPKPE